MAIPEEARLWVFNTHTKHALIDGAYAARHRECMEAAEELGVKQLVEMKGENLAENLAKLSPIPAKRAQHVVEEISRVEATVAALRKGDLQETGRLLTASHRSSQHLFENSTEELDFLVDTLIVQPGVLGARLTGGGFGGAVMALTNPEFAESQAETVRQSYREKYGSLPDVIRTRTDDGAEVI